MKVRRRRRKLHLKVRFRAPKGATEEQLLGWIEDVIAGTELPDGVVIRVVDWSTGEGATAKTGQYTDDDIRQALVDFYNAMTAHRTTVRVATVETE